MPFKDLEHEGNENFEKGRISNREDVREVQLLKKKQSEDAKEEELEKKQQQWLYFDNPALWDGEI